MSRRNFDKKTKVVIIKRATIGGQQWCEKCGALAKKFEIHHLREDGLEVDKSKPLTAKEGALWCEPCHDEHTRKFSTPAVAVAKRQEAAALGADKPNKAKIAQPPKSPRSTFKQDQIRALREARFR